LTQRDLPACLPFVFEINVMWLQSTPKTDVSVLIVFNTRSRFMSVVITTTLLAAMC